MSHYIDGFVLPIPRDKLDAYERVVAVVAEVWKSHGALDYREYVGDDMTLEGTRTFPDAVDATDDDVVVFGWVVFESREARDRANAAVPNDAKMIELMNSTDCGFDATRMVYGGFRPIGA